MRFTKMHGAGNDYVYVDCFSQQPPANPSELAKTVSNRHKGIGGDGLILIRPSVIADAQMQMFNADGSEAEMCGNGIRCVAKYLYDHGICQKKKLNIETPAGILALELTPENGKVREVQVDMGEPILLASNIPTTLPGNPEFDDRLVNIPLSAGGHDFEVTCLSMGNPHCVIFVERATDDLVLRVGPLIENDPAFPARTNVEFVEVKSPTEVHQRTWERGSGETQACGTGASAVCVAGVLSGRTERTITNELLGGVLTLHWNADSNRVLMTGPATEVFSGDWNPNSE